MQINVNREELIKTLQSVLPGISPKGVIEQSNAFIFKEGKVLTYNDEVACSCKSGLPKSITAAVHAEPLVNLLLKLEEESVDLVFREERLVIIGKKKKGWIVLDKDITIDLSKLEEPKTWKKLPDNFLDIVQLVQECAASPKQDFQMSCLHVTPTFIEACNNDQMIRYKTKLDLSQPVLVKRNSIKPIVELGMTEFAETDSWMHFRNSGKLLLSCRRFVESYRDLSSFYKIKGTPAKLPKGLAKACEKAEIFSAEDADNNQVKVSLAPGSLRITGEGVSGGFTELKDVAYKGKKMSFMIPPKLLTQIAEQHNECEVADNALRVNGGDFIYVTALSPVETGEKNEA